jgi:hypothetical protein
VIKKDVGNGGTAPRINIGTKWRGVVSHSYHRRQAAGSKKKILARVAVVHKFFKIVGATSKFEAPEV